ncbi:MAG: 6-pyruvoyl-tetrahydropterin synthase-related protein [Candidatus Aenigmarchaeota archaeon]|nr:6-pyruvoyl-tetrahydropterin synthase-related protein [Candidatus Aenigmarchaeota archaeon]
MEKKYKVIKRLFSWLFNNREMLVNIFILIFIFAFLLNYFKPELLLSETITAGGDTASHYYPAEYLKEYLLPHGKVVGWCPGWYAGFPLFQFYFPLAFILMAVLSYLIPLQIAFKLVTVLGSFLLPICAFYSMRLMKFKFPMPALAAVFTLPFLFMEANSMWGGNIPSTLAGEFSYSISLAIAVLFLGSFYRDLEEKKGILVNSFLVFLIALTHVYTLLFIGLTSIFFLIKRNKEAIISNFYYTFKTYFLGFLLSAIWTIPLFTKLEFTISYNYVWVIDSIKTVFPDILLPIIAFAILGFIISIKKRDNRIWYISFSLVSAMFLFLIASKIGVVDIRFVPFMQLFIMFIGAYGALCIIKLLKGKWLAAIIITILTIFWVSSNVTFIPAWINWNYQGFENKPLWASYKDVNDYLHGDESSPRVVYEHSDLHNQAGSLRAYESLPLFSGRSTLEGLYMQSTISSPFVFYIQSEISEVVSCPLPGYACSPFNLENGLKHLKMFNVKNIIARSDKLKEEIKTFDNVELVRTIEPYNIYEILDNENRYVTVPAYEPVLFQTNDWKKTSYEWFKLPEQMEIPLVFSKNNDLGFETSSNLDNLPRIMVDNNCSISERVTNETIAFTTSCVGKPHIISISYYPNWQVKGADKIYLVSPSFMLVYPNRNEVTLYYGMTGTDYLAILLSLAGFVIILYNIFRSQRVKRLLKR